MESDDDENTPLIHTPKLGKKGEQLAPCGRPAFSANPVNKRYNSRYRNPENQNRLGGKLLELGKTTGIVAMTLFGFDVSLELAHAADRLWIFKSAAWYALQARKFFQTEVFAPLVENPLFQEHLALAPGQRVQSL